MNNTRLKSNLARYIDAGFPIIYINTFEEEKVDELAASVGSGREIYEWMRLTDILISEPKRP